MTITKTVTTNILDRYGDCIRLFNSRQHRHSITIGGGKGIGKGGIRPGRHWGGGGIWSGENKYEILKFDGFWQIAICIAQTVIFYTPQYPVMILPSFGTAHNCQCSTTPHKAVCTPRNLHCYLTDHSPALKLYIHIVQLLFCWQSQFRPNVLHYSRVSKFCIKFGNSAWNLVI